MARCGGGGAQPPLAPRAAHGRHPRGRGGRTHAGGGRIPPAAAAFIPAPVAALEWPVVCRLADAPGTGLALAPGLGHPGDRGPRRGARLGGCGPRATGGRVGRRGPAPGRDPVARQPGTGLAAAAVARPAAGRLAGPGLAAVRPEFQLCPGGWPALAQQQLGGAHLGACGTTAHPGVPGLCRHRHGRAGGPGLAGAGRGAGTFAALEARRRRAATAAAMGLAHRLPGARACQRPGGPAAAGRARDRIARGRGLECHL